MHFTNLHMSQGCQIHNFIFMLIYVQKIANKVKLMLLPWFDACGGGTINFDLFIYVLKL